MKIMVEVYFTYEYFSEDHVHHYDMMHKRPKQILDKSLSLV